MSFQFSLYDALVGVDVPPEKARAVIDALERDMGATLATKTTFSSSSRRSKARRSSSSSRSTI
jgi:hypothetical protein